MEQIKCSDVMTIAENLAEKYPYLGVTAIMTIIFNLLDDYGGAWDLDDIVAAPKKLDRKMKKRMEEAMDDIDRNMELWRERYFVYLSHIVGLDEAESRAIARTTIWDDVIESIYSLHDRGVPITFTNLYGPLRADLLKEIDQRVRTPAKKRSRKTAIKTER